VDMLAITWLGDSYDVVCGYSKELRRAIGFELHFLQQGERPIHARSMKTVGRSVWEIRVSESGGVYRVVYVVKRNDGIYVLNVFQKKTRKTPKHQIELAQERLKEIRDN
jgi:phage-related protein